MEGLPKYCMPIFSRNENGRRPSGRKEQFLEVGFRQYTYSRTNALALLRLMMSRNPEVGRAIKVLKKARGNKWSGGATPFCQWNGPDYSSTFMPPSWLIARTASTVSDPLPTKPVADALPAPELDEDAIFASTVIT